MAYAELLDDLTRRGALTLDWAPVFRAVPRTAFVPDRIWTGPLGDQPTDRGSEPEKWAALVASDIPLVTRHTGDGVARIPASSCSMPYMVATMLRQLDVTGGNSVLEVGTGTGWNAALLAHRLGAEHVTSVEVDPQVAAEAANALKSAGHRPNLLIGDGLAGRLVAEPVDRLLATCAVRAVPYRWVEQVQPGGVIVAPWGSAFRNGVLLRLTVGLDGTASGPVVDDADFMFAAGHAPHRDVMGLINADADSESGTTGLDPRVALHDDVAFVVGVRLPGVVRSVGYGSGEAAGELTVWLADPDTGSWAAVDYVPGATEFEVSQYGTRRLWDEVDDSYRWWWAAGCPERVRFGVSVTPAGQLVWLDAPGREAAGGPSAVDHC